MRWLMLLSLGGRLMGSGSMVLKEFLWGCCNPNLRFIFDFSDGSQSTVNIIAPKVVVTRKKERISRVVVIWYGTNPLATTPKTPTLAVDNAA